MSGFISNPTTEAQLNTDIQLLDGTTAAGTYTITLGANIALASTVALDALNLHSNVDVVIDGGGHTLNGGDVRIARRCSSSMKIAASFSWLIWRSSAENSAATGPDMPAWKHGFCSSSAADRK